MLFRMHNRKIVFTIHLDNLGVVKDSTRIKNICSLAKLAIARSVQLLTHIISTIRN